MDSTDRQRLDRWLWHTRFFKSRALAAESVVAGHVKVNGERPRSGHRIRIGDRLDIVRLQERFVVQVTALPERRGPASEALACYFEEPAALQAREAARLRLRQDRLMMPRTQGRPDKHTRRLLRKRNRSE
ncbi:MAG: RNA-binding S4 domain-containing protein [Woeseia sp.]